MCTLAGYIGSERAAPLLLEMIKRQEGLWSGFYSGAVTAADGDLHWEKTIGTFEKLELETPVRELPGTVGLVHSRTKSGGDVEWGHPFVSNDATVAVVAQGGHGLFASNASRVALGDELLAQESSFRTATPGTIGRYPTLSDGNAIHTSELNTEAVARAYAECGDPCDAIRRVASCIPSEAVFAYLFRDRPDQLFISNVNQRIVIARNATGTFFASSAFALPDEVHWRMELSGNMLAVIDREEVHLQELAAPGAVTVDERLPAELDATVLAYLRENPRCSLPQIHNDAVAPRLPSGRLWRKSPAAYTTVERLVDAGLVTVETEPAPGVFEGETAPLTVFSAAG